jgi:hypothetical protein
MKGTGWSNFTMMNNKKMGEGEEEKGGYEYDHKKDEETEKIII